MGSPAVRQISKRLKTANTQERADVYKNIQHSFHTPRQALKRKEEAIRFYQDTTHKLYMTGYFLLYFNDFVDTSKGTVAMSWFTGW